MKIIKSLKFIGVIMIAAAFVFVLKSCKKVESNNNINKVNPVSLTGRKETMMNAIQKKYGKLGAGIVIPVNKKAEDLLYRAKDGKMTNMFNTAAEKSNNSFGGGHTNGGFCKFDCSTASSVSQFVQIFTLNSIQRFYQCESNGNYSTVVVSWTISVPYSLVNGVSPPVVNYGRLLFTPSIGSPVTLPDADPQYGITPVPNPDPNCASNQIFEIYYVYTNVPNSDFATGTVMSTDLGMNTDCSLVGGFVSTGYVSAPAFNQNAYLPCNRVDKVYINPYAGPSLCAHADGNISASACTYPTTYGFVVPDAQQVEYRLVNAWGPQDWDAQTSYIYWGVLSPSGTTPVPSITTGATLNLLNMTPSSGTWLVRYRNVKTSTCGVILNSGTSPDVPNPNPDPAHAGAGAYWGTPSLWVTEVWPL